MRGYSKASGDIERTGRGHTKVNVVPEDEAATTSKELDMAVNKFIESNEDGDSRLLSHFKNSIKSSNATSPVKATNDFKELENLIKNKEAGRNCVPNIQFESFYPSDVINEEGQVGGDSGQAGAGSIGQVETSGQNDRRDGHEEKSRTRTSNSRAFKASNDDAIDSVTTRMLL